MTLSLGSVDRAMARAMELRTMVAPQSFTRVLHSTTTQPATAPASLHPVTVTQADHGQAPQLPAGAHRWAGAIRQAAQRHGLDPNLLTAVVWTESSFVADAVSPAGAIGLAQLMPGTAAGLGVDPTDPIQNLDGGARYLREMIDRFGRVDLALAAYNAGPTRLSGLLDGTGRVPIAQSYVDTVLTRAESLGGSQ